MVSLGCPKNLVDSEVMLGLAQQAGHELTRDPAGAEVLVVNTCAFIDKAKQESVDAILEMAEFKKSGACKTLVVAGCGGGGTGSAPPSAEPRTLTVFAAASLTETFTEIGKLFETENPGVTVRLNFGASSDLAQQIVNGGPADVFVAGGRLDRLRQEPGGG